MTKISVIMPVYNTKPTYLQQAIESILNQTLKDFKFLILNDSPENPSIKGIVKKYNDKRILYYEHTSNQGIARSYNHLLTLANTKYIALMNHDDISLSTRLEEQFNFLEQNQDIGLVGTAYKKFGEINRFKNIYPPIKDENIRALLLFKSPIHHPTIMIRKQIIVQHNIRYNENYISLNDRRFYYDFCKYSKLANLDRILYKYRFHKDMISKKQGVSEQSHSVASFFPFYACLNVRFHGRNDRTSHPLFSQRCGKRTPICSFSACLDASRDRFEF